MAAGLEEALRARGLRVTEQRRVVLEAVDSLGHCTAEQVFALVQEHTPSLNLSTVYRTLDLLQELGLITHAHLEHGAPTYHSTREADHLHLVCRSCGKVEEAAPGAGKRLAVMLLEEKGFVTDVRHLAVHGTCRDCARD